MDAKKWIKALICLLFGLVGAALLETYDIIEYYRHKKRRHK
jgi:hypothetical protein